MLYNGADDPTIADRDFILSPYMGGSADNPHGALGHPGPPFYV